jgi:serine/threonine-protein kinase RsbW
MAEDLISLDLTFPSNLESVELIEGVVQLIASRCGLNEEELHRTLMAVHECVINAIYHGNKDDSQRRVGLNLQAFSDRLEIKVRDEGNPFDPADIPDPLQQENLLKPTGRGVFLIQAFMDQFSVGACKDWGKEVTMVKKISSSV